LAGFHRFNIFWDFYHGTDVSAGASHPRPISQPTKQTNKQGVCHKGCGLAIYIKKDFKAKRRIMETQIFHHAKI
jgi:hypothetical protein